VWGGEQVGTGMGPARPNLGTRRPFLAGVHCGRAIFSPGKLRSIPNNLRQRAGLANTVP
jgi:hypothetical protein